jgi:hypothetical protein
MKKALIIISVLIAGLIAWVVAFPSKNPVKKLFAGNDEPAAPGSNMITLPTPGEAIPTGNIQTGTTDNMPGFPLSQGSRGEYVKNMQRALNDRFGTALVVDGIFGPKTYKAVSANGFEADAVTYAEYMEILGQAW